MKRLLIEDLLQKSEKVTIPVDKENAVDLWVRPSTPTERAMAASFGRKESRNLRKLLNNKKTEEYLSLIKSEVEASDRQDLEKIWLNGKLIPKIMELRNRSLEAREYIPEPEGEGVTGKAMDEYEDAVDESEESREEQLGKALESATNELQEEVKKIADKDLYKVAIPPLIDSLCNQAFELEFISRLILKCTFENEECTVQAFTDIEQAYKLKASARKKLTYAHMEMLNDPEEIKN